MQLTCVLRALLLASAAGYAAGCGVEHVREEATRDIERAAVSAYASGVVEGWASCSCWDTPFGTLTTAGPVLVEDVTGEPDPYGPLEGTQ